MTVDGFATLLARYDDDGITRLSGRRLLIYGAGNYGRIIYRLLTESGFPASAILGFLDTSPGEVSIFGLPVWRPDDKAVSRAMREESEVVISIYCSEMAQRAIAETLTALGYQGVRSCYEIAISFHQANDPSARIHGSGYLRDNRDHILNGVHFWADQRSIDTYLNHFAGYALCDPQKFLCETDHRQYFPAAPLLRKGPARFIDCGAFDGDTVRELHAQYGRVDKLALFEPCKNNYAKLASFIRRNVHDLAGQMVVFPCGAWDQVAQLSFSGDSASASSISAGGKEYIQCVALDDALPGFAPTMIKMDIEGAEPFALRGAEAMIREYKPDLAISVYHALAHFWEIPAMVKRWVPEYHLYLRTYAAAGFETVMYAVADAERGRP